MRRYCRWRGARSGVECVALASERYYASQYEAFPQLFVDKLVAGGPIFVHLAKRSEISLKVRAELAAADVVFCDDDADRGVVALTRLGALVEFVAVDGAAASSRPSSVARARRLASDGWRVVWVASANVDRPVDCTIDAGVAEIAPVGSPHALATAFNGLAG